MKPPVKTKPAAPPTKPGRMVIMADVIPDGDGRYTVTPKKPGGSILIKGGTIAREVTTREACQLLNVGRACIHYLINDPGPAKEIIKYRFTTPGRRRRMFDVASLFAYLEYTKTLEGK